MMHISEKEWRAMIKSLENDFNRLETNKKRAVRDLKDKIIESIKKNGINNCGVLFSGGIDSTLIALILKKLNFDFRCYVVGMENAQDLEWAEKVAKELDFKLEKKILSLDELEIIVKAVTKLLNEADVMKVSVGSVIYAASLLAKKDNIKVLFSGLGSEELFAGYERHLNAIKCQKFSTSLKLMAESQCPSGKRKISEHAQEPLDASNSSIIPPVCGLRFLTSWEGVHKECWNGLEKMWERDLKRDFLISDKINIQLRIPFLDKDMIIAAMNIHPMYKISNEYKKIILREVAEEFDLKKEFAWRKKKAAQYGSSFIKGIDKLAKKKGFKYKKDYLKSLL